MSVVRLPELPSPLHARFLDPGSLLSLVRRAGVPAAGVAVDHIRLKRESAIVGISIDAAEDGGIRVQGYVRVQAPDRARALAEKWSRLRAAPTPLGPGVRLLPGAEGVLFLFPNDNALRGVRAVLAVDKLKRVLDDLPGLVLPAERISGKRSGVSLVRYKPERRVIARARLALVPVGDGSRYRNAAARRSERRVFLRYFPDARGSRIAEIASALRSSGFVHVPRPFGALLHGRLFVEEEVQGVEILPSVLQGRADAEALASALLALHARRGIPVRAAAHPGVVAAGGLAALAGAGAVPEQMAADVRAGLRRSLPADRSTAPIHGDLHLHQVVLGPSGPVLVDLERAALGHPLQDLGDLVAHLDALALRDPPHAPAVLAFRDGLLDSYLARSPSSDRDLPFFVACGLVDLALLAFRRQEPGWADASRRLLGLALEETAPARRARR